jgi:transcriptional regulator with XRE-family HTH domain
MTSAAELARSRRGHLSRVLRQLRKASKLTGEVVASRASMSQSKLSKIETGLLLPSPDDVERLADVVGASLDAKAQLKELVVLLRGEAKATRVVLHRGGERRQVLIERTAARARVAQTVVVSAFLRCSGHRTTRRPLAGAQACSLLHTLQTQVVAQGSSGMIRRAATPCCCSRVRCAALRSPRP